MEFARALAEADLLVENRADITLPDGQRLAMSGFKVIDEAKFNKLPDEEFLRWRANGWLPLVLPPAVDQHLAGADQPAATRGPGRGSRRRGVTGESGQGPAIMPAFFHVHNVNEPASARACETGRVLACARVIPGAR